MCQFQQVWPIKARREKKKKKKRRKRKRKRKKEKGRKTEKVEGLRIQFIFSRRGVGKPRKFGLVEPTKQGAIGLQLHGIIRQGVLKT